MQLEGIPEEYRFSHPNLDAASVEDILAEFAPCPKGALLSDHLAAELERAAVLVLLGVWCPTKRAYAFSALCDKVRHSGVKRPEMVVFSAFEEARVSAARADRSLFAPPQHDIEL